MSRKLEFSQSTAQNDENIGIRLCQQEGATPLHCSVWGVYIHVHGLSSEYSILAAGTKLLTPSSTCCVQVGTCQTVFLYWYHHYENDRFIVSSNLPVAIARLRYFCKLIAFDLPKTGVALPLTEKPGQQAHKSKSCFYIACFFSCRPERVLEKSGPTLHASKKFHTFKFIRLAIFILATWVSLHIINI